MAKAVPLSRLPDETVRGAVELIIENLRPADAAEITATLAGPVADAVRISVAVSTHAWLIVDRRGVPIGLFGVAPTFFPDVGTPWLVGTAGIEREALSVARQTRPYVAEMLEAYPVLTNHVDVRNDAAIDWLLWSGFSLIDAVPHYGPERRPFLQFSRTT